MMDLIIGGLFVGIGGAVFSVGVTFTKILSERESWFCKWYLRCR